MRTRTRTDTVVALALSGLLLTSCGTVVGDGATSGGDGAPSSAGDGAPSSTGDAAATSTGEDASATGPDAAASTATEAIAAAVESYDLVEPGTELVFPASLYQDGDGPVMLCTAMMESFPPQCSGPTLEGEVDWDAVRTQEDQGIRWTESSVYAVGTLDQQAGDLGTFTLTEPLSGEGPDGWEPPASEQGPREPACEDPTADVPEVDQQARVADGTSLAEETELAALAEQIDGFVEWWVSYGTGDVDLSTLEPQEYEEVMATTPQTVSIAVTSDPESVRGRVREVFSGPLCVVQQEGAAPLETVMEAADALGAAGLPLQHVGPSGGKLEVGVLVLEKDVVEEILTTVAPWLTPDQVTIVPTLSPRGD